MRNKNVKILNLQAKDIFKGEYIVKRDKKYIGSLDDGLEVDKLKKVDEEKGYEQEGKRIIKNYKEFLQLSKKVNYIVEEIKELEKGDDKNKEEIEELYEQISDTEDKIDILKFYSNDIICVCFDYKYESDLDKMEEELTELQNKRNTLELEFIEDENDSKNTIKELEDRINPIIRELENEIKELKLDKIKNKKELASKNKLLKETKKPLSELKKELAKIRKDFKRNKSDINNLENETRSKYILSTKKLRSKLYREGFKIKFEGSKSEITYKRYKRSSGSAREGKCLFINEKYLNEMLDWSFAGIDHEEGIEMDIAGTEAYISLTTSSSIDRFELKAENILLIKDEYSVFNDEVIGTKLINPKKDKDGNIVAGDLLTEKGSKEIKNNIWDGQSLLDKSIFENGGYKNKAILQVRNRHFKGIGVNTDIQKFFKDNNITKIEELNGLTRATKVEDIKLITTESSVKYMKRKTFEEWLDNALEDTWAICKYEKPQHHFNQMVQTHYQLVNTSGMSKEEMREFLQDTLRYIGLLKNDTAVFKNHLKIKAKQTIEELTDDSIEEVSAEEIALEGKVINNASFILNMLEINDDFINTKMCRDFRRDVYRAYINNVRRGHVLVTGNYSTIVSNPLEMLKNSIIGGWDKTSSSIKPFECVSSKFKSGERILGVRSPQPTMCNVAFLTNRHNYEMDEYFNTKSKEVIYISAIGTNEVPNNIMERLSSLDFDGDAMLVTNNKYLLAKEEEYKKFLVSTDFTPKSPIAKKYCPEDLCNTDYATSSNKIGEIINLAQMLNSVYWNKKSKGASQEELDELYKDICTLNVLSCIEIDRCKKISPVSASKELKRIREKGYLEDKTRPYFMKFLQKGNVETEYIYKKMNTPMDYLEGILNQVQRKKRDSESGQVEIIDLMQKPKCNMDCRRKIDTILKIVEEMDKKQSEIWSNKDITNKYDLANEEEETALSKLEKVTLTDEIIYKLVKNIKKDNSRESKIARKLLRLLFKIDSVKFLSCFKVVSKPNTYLYQDENGEVDIYGVKFIAK